MDRIPELVGESERLRAKLGYYDDDHRDRAVVSFAEPISSGYVLIKRDHLAHVTSLERERWTPEHLANAARLFQPKVYTAAQENGLMPGETRREMERPPWFAVIGTITLAPLFAGSVIVLGPYLLSGWKLDAPFFGWAPSRWIGGAHARDCRSPSSRQRQWLR